MLYCCYVFCGDFDRGLVYDYFVVLLRKENIIMGFIFEECLINRSGKLVFNIYCDLFKKCEYLIFYLIFVYLEEEKFVDI